MTFPFHLPKETGQSRIFYAQGAGFQPYNIPYGAKMLNIIAVGRGGNAGAGHSAAAATARGGGGSGGSGAITRILIPTSILPDTLWVLPGSQAAGESYVCTLPAIAAANTIVRANAGGSGNNGTGSAVGTAGAAGAITSTATRGPYSTLGVYESLAGQAGVTGGAIAGAAGTAITWGAVGLFVSAGASGAGTTSADFAGGDITGGGLVPTIAGGVAGSNPGNSGYFLMLPPSFTGGSGGGSSNTGVGGAGGNGGYGSGGGGGGGGTTGGAGGIGGDGLVFITHIF